MPRVSKGRRALSWGALLLAALTAFGCLQATKNEPEARHLILFIGDGMQLEHERAASLYLTGTDRNLSFHVLPQKGFAATWDVTTYNRYALAQDRPAYHPDSFDPRLGYDPSRGGTAPYPDDHSGEEAFFLTRLDAWGGGGRSAPATDSASAATAIATGVKTEAGKIAWLPEDPDKGEIATIMEKARARRGLSIGVVTTVPFSHATPAAFVSHNRSRSNYQAIAAEIIHGVRPEVVIGAGHPGWNRDPYRYIAEDDFNALKTGTAGYTLVERQTGIDGGETLLAQAKRPSVTRLFGLFGGVGGNFESPVPTGDGSRTVRRATIENPTLAEATEAALEVLGRNRKGFVVLIEQGDIDWANHANDYARMVGTVYDLDRAVAAAVDFVNRPGDGIDWNNTLLVVTSDHGNNFMRIRDAAALRSGQLPAQRDIDGNGVFNDTDAEGVILSYPDREVSFGSTGHTNELVTWYGRGKAASFFAPYEGAWYAGSRIIDNTHFHLVFKEALDLRH